MIIATVRVNCVSAESSPCPYIPKGAAGCKVAFEFTDPRWNKLSKTVVFRNKNSTKDAILTDNCAVIPHELLTTVKDILEVGVYGTNPNSNLAIPTVWARIGEIGSAAYPSGDPATTPTLPYWAQIQAEVETLGKEMMRQDDLENVLIQAKESGEFDGPKGDQGPQGEKGDPGEKGRDGYSPIRGTDYWTTADKQIIVSEASQNVLRTVQQSCDIVCEVSGQAITLADASSRLLQGLQVYGKTSQNGTPIHNSPVELRNIGRNGSITINIGTTDSDKNPQILVFSTPNGLPGIPVSSNGNYSDKNGQQWICDELDFSRGIYVQRIKETTLSKLSGGYNGTNFYFFTNDKAHGVTNVMCSHWPVRNALLSTETYMCKGHDAESTFYIRDINYTDISTLKAEQGNAVIQYELAIPVETALSTEVLAAYAVLHTNKLDSTIWNNSEAFMKVKYVADTKAYVDKQLLALVRTNFEIK